MNIYDTVSECINENIVGGHLVCHIRGGRMNCRCKYFDETKEWKEYLKELDKESNDNIKPSWNEPRGRCIEGIPDDFNIPKTHLDEWDYKQRDWAVWQEWSAWLFNKYHLRVKI